MKWTMLTSKKLNVNFVITDNSLPQVFYIPPTGPKS